jgi:hypothetical protein
VSASWSSARRAICNAPGLRGDIHTWFGVTFSITLIVALVAIVRLSR